MDQHKTALDLSGLKFDAQGLIPAVVQDAASDEVLMVAFMNRESLARTLESGQTWFWSRSRGRLWHKGEESGHVQEVQEIRADCDLDTLLVRVRPRGPACHTGQRSCFFRRLQPSAAGGSALVTDTETAAGAGARRLMHTVAAIRDQIADRRARKPEGSYTAYLFEHGLDKILKKVGEESAEVIIAAKNNFRTPLVAEMSDLVYHLLVLAEQQGVGADELAAELEARRK